MKRKTFIAAMMICSLIFSSVCLHQANAQSEENKKARVSQKINAADSDKRSKNEALSQENSSRGLKGKMIVIDPGHGGIDHGVVGKKYGSSEKSLNLKTSRYLVDKLRQAGAQVIMTRTDDKDNPTLSKRVEVSEKNTGGCFYQHSLQFVPQAG